jgi:DNA-binding LacI/PurR family transcriptional regulator
MGRGYVTSAEVAKRAGVSRSAVSRTFTTGASVSREVRRKVEKAAKELGYRVNRIAQGLISNRSTLVGVVGTHLADPFTAKQLDHLSLALLNRGMQCMLLNAAEAEQDIAPLIEMILEFRVRAVVVLSGTPPTAIVNECLACGVRLVLINKPTDDTHTDMIMSDDLTGAKLAATRLVDAGCRKVAVVTSGSGTQSQRRRSERFSRLARKAGLEVVSWAKGITGYDAGAQAARELLVQKDIDGAFCVTDLLALGFLDAARLEMGRKVPKDLSIIGFDDIPQAGWSAYRLTTIAQSFPDLTEAVIKALDRDSETEEKAPQQVVPVRLIERATVR